MGGGWGKLGVMEFDLNVAESLGGHFKAEDWAVVTDDALRLDWADLISDGRLTLRSHLPVGQTQTRVRIVANLPYYISTPIIERLLSLGGRVFDMTLMLQKEVADRITTGPGSKAYGSLTVVVDYYCVALKVFDVPPASFTPSPKVQSAVIKLTVRERPAFEITDEAQFVRLVRAAFAQRRKTILNNLKASANSLAFTRSVESALEAASVSPRRRAETVSLAEFAALYRALHFERGECR